MNSKALYILGGILIIGIGVALWFVQPSAQKTITGPIVIGLLQYLPVTGGATDGFKQGMKDLGYEENASVVYKIGAIGNTSPEMEKVARDLIEKEKLDLVYAVTSVAARAAVKATKELGKTELPVVYAHADHPVETGLAQSIKSSGNNATGIAVDLSFLTAKRLEFLKEINPSMKRLGVLSGKQTDPAGQFAEEELKTQAPRFGLEIVDYVIQNPPGPEAKKELDALANRIKTGDIDAMFQIPGSIPSWAEGTSFIINAAKKLKIPAAVLLTPQVERGGLFSYGHDMFAIGQQASRIVQKIIEGTRPTNIPIEVPEKNTLAINLKTAKEIGVTLPETLLFLANRKFE